MHSTRYSSNFICISSKKHSRFVPSALRNGGEPRARAAIKTHRHAFLFVTARCYLGDGIRNRAGKAKTLTRTMRSSGRLLFPRFAERRRTPREVYLKSKTGALGGHRQLPMPRFVVRTPLRPLSIGICRLRKQTTHGTAGVLTLCENGQFG